MNKMQLCWQYGTANISWLVKIFLAIWAILWRLAQTLIWAQEYVENENGVVGPGDCDGDDNGLPTMFIAAMMMVAALRLNWITSHSSLSARPILSLFFGTRVYQLQFLFLIFNMYCIVQWDSIVNTPEHTKLNYQPCVPWCSITLITRQKVSQFW